MSSTYFAATTTSVRRFLPLQLCLCTRQESTVCPCSETVDRMTVCYSTMRSGIAGPECQPSANSTVWSTSEALGTALLTTPLCQGCHLLGHSCNVHSANIQLHQTIMMSVGIQTIMMYAADTDLQYNSGSSTSHYLEPMLDCKNRSS